MKHVYYHVLNKGGLVWLLIPFLLISLLTFMSNQAQAIAPARIAYWHLDETTGAPYVDVVNNYDGTCAGSCPTASPDGQVNGGQLFDGINAGIVITTDANFNWDANDSFSVEMWVKAVPGQTCATADESMVGRSDSGAGNGFWSLGCSGGTGIVQFQLEDTTGGSLTLASTKAITNGVWHHIVGVRDGVNDVNSLYLDGIEVISVTQSFSGQFAPSTADISLGHLETTAHFDGVLDEVAIYQGVLEPSEIRTHYYVPRGYTAACDTPIPIMPLGDSITKGSGTLPFMGYRKPLYLSLTGALYDIDFVGSASDGDATFDMDHEGHSGWYADDPVFTAKSILLNVDGWLTGNPAEVVLLQIGTNDIDDGQDAASAVIEVDQLLDEIDTHDERITVVLAQITNIWPISPTITAFNDGLAAMVQTRLAAGDKVILVDQENALIYPDDLTADNIHPNSGGYDKMADVWLAALNQFMPICAEAAPAIVSEPITETIVGQAYTYTVQASGNPPPTYTLTVNPGGMVIDEVTGLVSWTPVATGTVDVTVEAHNSMGFDVQNFMITVTEETAVSPLIITDPITATTVNQPYNYDVNASGNPMPTYTLTVSPTGMLIDEMTGEISWLSSTTGTVNVTVEAHNVAGNHTQSFAIDVAAAPMCPADMTAYWKLDETSGTVYDDFVNVHDGSCVGTCPTPVNGIIGSAQQFSTTNVSVIDVPVNTDFDWGKDDSFSIEFWLKGVAGETCTSSSEVVIGREDPNDPGVHWWLGCSQLGGGATFQLGDSTYDSATQNGVKLEGPVVNDGTWHHIVGVRDGVTDIVYLYVDGTAVISSTYDYTAGFGSATAPLNVGWLDHRAIVKKFNINGTVDEMAVYGRSLTPLEVQTHYLNGLNGLGYCDAPIDSIPVIESTAVTQVEVNQPYSYDVNASGHPTPTYTLLTELAGMEIVTETGVITWLPSAGGIYSVIVQASNRAGADTQEFDITVIQAPAITSSPVTQVDVGQLYTYDVDATGFPLPTYAFVGMPPGGMTIDANSGLISWTPDTVGVFPVTVEADGGIAGKSVPQSFNITVGVKVFLPVMVKN